VRDNRDRQRYELIDDGSVIAIADYERVGDVLVLPHTEVIPARRNQGVGAELVKAVLEEARAAGCSVVPRCWFVADYIDDNPEYRSLVAS